MHLRIAFRLIIYAIRSGTASHISHRSRVGDHTTKLRSGNDNARFEWFTVSRRPAFAVCVERCACLSSPEIHRQYTTDRDIPLERL